MSFGELTYDSVPAIRGGWGTLQGQGIERATKCKFGSYHAKGVDPERGEDKTTLLLVTRDK